MISLCATEESECSLRGWLGHGVDFGFLWLGGLWWFMGGVCPFLYYKIYFLLVPYTFNCSAGCLLSRLWSAFSMMANFVVALGVAII